MPGTKSFRDNERVRVKPFGRFPSVDVLPLDIESFRSMPPESGGLLVASGVYDGPRVLRRRKPPRGCGEGVSLSLPSNADTGEVAEGELPGT